MRIWLDESWADGATKVVASAVGAAVSELGPKRGPPTERADRGQSPGPTFGTTRGSGRSQA